jgi:uncharacterized membrane-anchored protein
MTRKDILILVSVLLAVLAPLASAYTAHQNLKSYPVVKVRIEPFDPRDLMYGHYLQYRILWNWSADHTDDYEQNAGKCLCLGEGDDNPPASLVSCEAPAPEKTCAHIVQGDYHASGVYDIGINRYYLDEEFAPALETVFRDKKADFSIGLAIAPSGKPKLERLYIDGKPWQDYVATMPKEETPETVPAP